MATSSLRWGRIVLGGVLAEVALILVVIPMRMLESRESAITGSPWPGRSSCSYPLPAGSHRRRDRCSTAP